ncbi:MAG: DUF4236 domain-containing protein [Bacteroidota bacterium]
MGWYVRKSFKLGPLRFNLSNSGVSTSFGVKGARINFSKRGTYVNLGANGIYYRQKINTSGRSRTSNNNQDSNFYNNNPDNSFDMTPEDGLTDTGSRNFIDELQQKGNRKSLMFWLAGVPSFLALIALLIFLETPIATNKTYSAELVITKNSVHIRENPSVHGSILQTSNKGESFKFLERVDNDWFKVKLKDSINGYVHADLAFVQPTLGSVEIIKRFDKHPWIRQSITAMVVVLIIAYCTWLYRFDKRRRTVQIYYQMDDKLKTLHEKFLECFYEFASSKRIWSTLSTEDVIDRKYNAGATQLVSRAALLSISNDRKPTRYLKTNVHIPHIGLKGISLFFFPERLVMETQGQFAAALYRNITIHISTTRFIETEPLAADASVADYTWTYLNKNGDPDLRFVYNPRLPICTYSVYNIQSTEGLNLMITTSKPAAMDSFASFINTIGAYQHKIYTPA